MFEKTVCTKNVPDVLIFIILNCNINLLIIIIRCLQTNKIKCFSRRLCAYQTSINISITVHNFFLLQQLLITKCAHDLFPMSFPYSLPLVWFLPPYCFSHQFKPGHDAVTMEDVVTGQLPDRLTDRVVFLTYRALHIAVQEKRRQRDNVQGVRIMRFQQTSVALNRNYNSSPHKTHTGRSMTPTESKSLKSSLK